MKLRNKKHEAFAQAVADGMSACEAYLTHISKTASVSTALGNASRLRNDSKVKARILELQQKASDVLEERLGFTKEQAMRVLLEIIMNKGRMTKRDSKLIERWSRGRNGETMGLPSKLGALKLLGEWCGWEMPKRLKLDGEAGEGLSSLAELLDVAKGFTGLPRDGIYSNQQSTTQGNGGGSPSHSGAGGG